MNRYYVYKCIADNGGAPCVESGLLSLCICKPAIRSTARQGDVIFAFASNSETPANRLVYIAIVTDKLTDGEYYELEKFSSRGDCIYQRDARGRFQIRPDASYHGTKAAMNRDIGNAPDYPRANSLLSDDFRYFGNKGTADWKRLAPELARLVESLGQGHRIEHARELRDELIALRKKMWQRHSKKVLGKPAHAPDQEGDDDEDEPMIKVCEQRCYYVTC